MAPTKRLQIWRLCVCFAADRAIQRSDCGPGHVTFMITHPLWIRIDRDLPTSLPLEVLESPSVSNIYSLLYIAPDNWMLLMVDTERYSFRFYDPQNNRGNRTDIVKTVRKWLEDITGFGFAEELDMDGPSKVPREVCDTECVIYTLEILSRMIDERPIPLDKDIPNFKSGMIELVRDAFAKTSFYSNIGSDCESNADEPEHYASVYRHRTTPEESSFGEEDDEVYDGEDDEKFDRENNREDDAEDSEEDDKEDNSDEDSNGEVVYKLGKTRRLLFPDASSDREADGRTPKRPRLLGPEVETHDSSDDSIEGSNSSSDDSSDCEDDQH
ncbi:hypothetical protein C8035_v010797 [Colletotrichum spinosum]|uniref:Ubiquitin-like protease family profile domain-containing protein n=1 Tax=Colletotrichum spinosum TaxID=1347390 RepID=A0A4R8Q7R5_9PEZI|nr:hypothetical protein C8035_v010797 [Colletotrichum spinosum]